MILPITCHERIEGEQQNVVLVEPRIKIFQVSKTAREKAGANRQHQGHGYLHHHERLPETGAAAGSARVSHGLERRRCQMEPGSAPGRDQAKRSAVSNETRRVKL